MRYQVRSYKREDMVRLATPPSGSGMSESFHTQYYDTEVYPQVGTNQPTNFFQTTKQSLVDSNMQSAGSFPNPQWFQLYAIGFEALVPPTTGAVAATSPWQDLWNIRIGSQAFLKLSISDKEYGRIPLRACHPTGGMSGFGYNVADATVGVAEYAQGSPITGGFWIGGGLWFPPNTNFAVQVTWGDTLLPVAAATKIKVILDGTIHRRIL